MIKRLLCVIMAAVMSIGLLAGCQSESAADTKEDNEIAHEAAAKIGVALWSSSDVLGSRCREIIMEAADALDVDVEFYDHGFSPGREIVAVQSLIADGCQGVVLCNSSDLHMDAIIDECDYAGTYLAQSFRAINRDMYPGTYNKALESAYYVGCVHENEIENGRNTAQMVLGLRDKKIGLIGWKEDDPAWILRYEGYKIAVEGANSIARGDEVTLLEPIYADITYEGGFNAVKELLSREPGMDALIVAGGGGEPLVGAMDALADEGRAGKIDVVATDFIDDMDRRIRNDTVVGASGGNYCDSLMAFMLVYNAIMKSDGYTDLSGREIEIIFPYLYAISPQDFVDFRRAFTDKLPYTKEGFIELSGLDPEGLKEEAAGYKKKW